MRRHIIILGCVLALLIGGVGPVTGGDGEIGDATKCCPPCDSCCPDCCVELTVECEGPPWSAAGCESYSCGTKTIVGYLSGGWSDSSTQLVIHATGRVELLFTWIDATGNDYLGTRFYEVEAGDYTFTLGNILLELFDSGITTHIGALRLDWRACGDSYIYLDSWAERRHTDQFNGNGQRATLLNEMLCPGIEASWHGTCMPETFMVDSCYEVQVLPDTSFVRAQFVSTSDTEWQIVYVDGHRVEVPPMMTDWPEMAAFNFVPLYGIIEVCVGKSDPWSGGLDISDACILSNFEMIGSETKRRISIPAFPMMIFN